MLRPLAAFAAALLTIAVPLPAQAGGLSTAPPNNGSGGVFLDLTPTTNPLFFEVFEVPTNAVLGAPIQVEVWTRPGTYVGFTTSNTGWTLVQTVSGTGGATTSTPVPFTLTPQTTWSNADITLFSDVARTGNVSFGGTQFTPRTFSGTIQFATTPVELQSFDVE